MTLQRKSQIFLREIYIVEEQYVLVWRSALPPLWFPSKLLSGCSQNKAELICSLERRYTNQFCGFICVFVLLSGGWWFFLFVWLCTWNCIGLIIQVVVYFVVGTAWIEILSKNCEQYRFGNTASFCKQYSCFYVCGPSGHTFYDIFVRNIALFILLK